MKHLKLLVLLFLLTACANERDIELNGRIQTFEPYGWYDVNELKNDSIQYRPCVGNIVWDFLTIQTIGVPIWLTGWQFYEPVKVKKEYFNCEIKKSTPNTTTTFTVDNTQ